MLASTLMFCVAGLHAQIGVEKAIPTHLEDGQEYGMTIPELIAFGHKLFAAMWTSQEGQGRPLSKGTATGPPLSDPTDPLVFPRNFNRISAPDTNSCSGCHNKPMDGGGGDIVGNVFVLGQRFDFATLDGNETILTKGNVDESGTRVSFDIVGTTASAQSGTHGISVTRKTIGMFGSGFLEMVARQMTADLQSLRDATKPGGFTALVTKGISFGTIKRNADGTWDTSQVVGIPAPSLSTSGPDSPPSLIIRPYHQAGNVISVRQFTNNAFNHHHGIQSEERFGIGVDADGDGFVNELTRADVTAVTLYQITLAAPGRVIPSDPTIRAAIVNGEAEFAQIGCATCHVPTLPLGVDSQGNRGWVYVEPNPYNPPGNLQSGDPDAPPISVDLTDESTLPTPRLKVAHNAVSVPAYTDLKLHDITSGPDDPNCEPLDMNQPAGSTGFFAGNRKFITRKLWGIANQHSFGHHGQYTTMREAVLAHHGEAQSTTDAFNALSNYDRDSIIEFLKSLQILTPETIGRSRAVQVLRQPRSLCVDEKHRDIACPPGITP